MDFSLKIENKSCLLLESEHQIAVPLEKPLVLQGYKIVEIENNFKFAIKTDEIEDKTKKYVSVFLLLYHLFQETNKENCLYIFFHNNFLNAAIFKGKKLAAGWRKRASKKDIPFLVKKIIQEFYSNECCFFIERIIIFSEEKDKTLLQRIFEENLIDTESQFINLAKTINDICAIYKNYLISLDTENSTLTKTFLISSISILVLILLFDAYLKFQIHSLQKEIINQEKKKENIKIICSDISKRIKKLSTISPLSEEKKENNLLIISKIKELFSIIPQEAYLYKAEFDKGSLVLDGVVVSKPIYYQKIHKFLKNVYPQSRIYFKRKKNYYRFSSFYSEKERIQ